LNEPHGAQWPAAFNTRRAPHGHAASRAHEQQ